LLLFTPKPTVASTHHNPSNLTCVLGISSSSLKTLYSCLRIAANDQLGGRSTEINNVQEIALPPRVYFNFERDKLYFREDWNKGVQGSWSCIMQFIDLLNESDLKRVKGLGFDVNARVCSLRPSGHYPILAGWDSLETLYLGFVGVKLGSHCLIGFRELGRKDYSAFMRRYRKNPCWRSMQSWPEDVDAVEQLRAEVPTMYQGYWEKLELVSIVQL
jgi:hypothetical protein